MLPVIDAFFQHNELTGNAVVLLYKTVNQNVSNAFFVLKPAEDRGLGMVCSMV